MNYSKEDLVDQVKRRILGRSLLASDDLFEAIVEIFQKLPKKDVDALLWERQVYFILPGTSVAIPFTIAPLLNKGKDNIQPRIWFILLEPRLEKKSKERIPYTIATELAHCLLDHTLEREREEPSTQKIKTDEQLAKWGFEKELKASKTYPFWHDEDHFLLVTSSNRKQS